MGNEGAGPIRSLFIKELIRRVHQELVESQQEREASGQPPIFQVQQMTVEVNFVITESSEAKGGLEFKVITVGGVDLGGSKGYQQQQVHKITLLLSALPYDDAAKLKDLEESGSGVLPREE